MTFFQFNVSVPDMPSKKTLQRKRAKARKKPVKGWENLPKMPTVLCKLIREYVLDFNTFPARLHDTCETWFDLHVKYKAVGAFVQIIPLPDPFEHPVLRPKIDHILLAVAENTKSSKGILKTIMKSQCIDQEEPSLRNKCETALENVLLLFDPISPVFRDKTERAGVRCSFSKLIQLAREGNTWDFDSFWPEGNLCPGDF